MGGEGQSDSANNGITRERASNSKAVGRTGAASFPTEGIAAPLLLAAAQELRLSRILATPLGLWVPQAPARDGTTNRVMLALTWDNR